MHYLYTEQALSEIRLQIRSRLVILFAVTAAVIGLLVFAMIQRIEWLAIAATLLCGFFAVFFTEIFVLPLVHYRRLITAALGGRNHTAVMEYVRTEPETSVVDGVPCRGLIFLGEPDKHGTREQLFYWDQEIKLPAFDPGAMITLCYTGRSIIGYQTAEA